MATPTSNRPSPFDYTPPSSPLRRTGALLRVDLYPSFVALDAKLSTHLEKGKVDDFCKELKECLTVQEIPHYLMYGSFYGVLLPLFPAQQDICSALQNVWSSLENALSTAQNARSTLKNVSSAEQDARSTLQNVSSALQNTSSALQNTSSTEQDARIREALAAVRKIVEVLAAVHTEKPLQHFLTPSIQILEVCCHTLLGRKEMALPLLQMSKDESVSTSLEDLVDAHIADHEQRKLFKSILVQPSSPLVPMNPSQKV